MYSRRDGWISLLAGTIITSVLGASYAYSAYRPELESLWSSSFLASLPFSFFIVVFAFSSIIGGRFYSLKGIKKTAFLSMFLTSIGLLLSSLIEYVVNPIYLIITYGFLTGLGNGFGYVPVVTLARKWFPDRAGLATGIVIFGYGGSALVFAPLKTILIGIHGLSITFIIIGLISATLGGLACYLIKDPSPEITKYYASSVIKRIVIPKKDIEPKTIVKTIDFWAIWISFLLICSPGLVLIGHLISFTETRGLDRIQGSIAVSVFSMFNALGRPPAGWISDKIGKYGRPITMIIFFTLQTLLFLLLTYRELDIILLFIAIALAGFFYGSALSLYPALTGDFFGLKYLSMNYSLVFTGWGVAGLIAPSLGGLLVDLTGGYEIPLTIFSIFSLIGVLICIFLKKRLKLYLE